MSRKNTSVTLYSIGLPAIALILVAGYIFVSQPQLIEKVTNRFKEIASQDEMQGEVPKEIIKPNLENSQKLPITEEQINALIKTNLDKVNVAGFTVEDAKVFIDGAKDMVTGTIKISNGMEFEFEAEPAADKLGINVTDLELASNEDSTLFNMFDGALKSTLQSAVDKIVEENSDKLEYLEIEDKSIILYFKEAVNLEE